MDQCQQQQNGFKAEKCGFFKTKWGSLRRHQMNNSRRESKSIHNKCVEMSPKPDWAISKGLKEPSPHCFVKGLKVPGQGHYREVTLFVIDCCCFSFHVNVTLEQSNYAALREVQTQSHRTRVKTKTMTLNLLVLTLPEANPEMRIHIQVVYLGHADNIGR